jgi:hypothetical protein
VFSGPIDERNREVLTAREEEEEEEGHQITLEVGHQKKRRKEKIQREKGMRKETQEELRNEFQRALRKTSLMIIKTQIQRVGKWKKWKDWQTWKA